VELSVHDKFFEMGGNSMLIVALHEALPAEVRPGIALADLFEFTTICSLAARIDQTNPKASASMIEGSPL
jgi:hypothetical protein